MFILYMLNQLRIPTFGLYFNFGFIQDSSLFSVLLRHVSLYIIYVISVKLLPYIKLNYHNDVL